MLALQMEKVLDCLKGLASGIRSANKWGCLSDSWLGLWLEKQRGSQLELVLGTDLEKMWERLRAYELE